MFVYVSVVHRPPPSTFSRMATDKCIITKLQSKYLARSAYYLAMTFINGKRIALSETKFHFQIEYCNVPTVALL